MKHKLSLPAALLAICCLAACAFVSPLQTAQTVEQKAYALYAEYTIAQGVAVTLVRDASVPAGVKEQIRKAEAVAFPIAEQLATTAQTVTEIREQFVVGITPQEKLESAVANLSNIYFAARPQLLSLINQVNAAKPQRSRPL